MECAVENLPKKYVPSAIEKKWTGFWSHQPFAPDPLSHKPKFCIVLPPPNVTGSLHLGHTLNATIIDAIARYKRMTGYETLLQPGTDHAGIITQVQVEKALAEEGLTKLDLGRSGFLERVWQWREKHGGTILKQLTRLGVSADWSRTKFTMDEHLSKAVRRQFVQLFHDSLIFRGSRIVNWDPVSQTVLSNLEVNRVTKELKLYYLVYQGQCGDGIEIATVRPETIFADVAVAVHPDDKRHQHLQGSFVRIPLTDRWIPVIADSEVDPAFGTGALKVTPASDELDFEIGQRHGLDMPVILDNDSKLVSHLVPVKYRGMDRFCARDAVASDLAHNGALVREVPHVLSLGISHRTGAVIEPVLSEQWFVDARKLADGVIAGMEKNELTFYPGRYAKTYRDWLENLKPWCISRQLWWGHEIPAWYDENGAVIVPPASDPQLDPTDNPAVFDANLTKDPDVFDTWFSSNLWPFSTLGWPDREDPYYQAFYPTNVLITGYDILYLWVARMAMAGYHLTGRAPFQDVVLHGLVLDKDGQKMSKSRGNGIDPVSIINESGADALRFAMAYSSTGGQDIRWDGRRVEMGRNFNNKLWNAARYILSRTGTAGGAKSDESRALPDRWIASRLQSVIEKANDAYNGYELGVVVRDLYGFAWSEYCDWYLESAKLYVKNPVTDRVCRQVFMSMLGLLHPIMPFITSELHEALGDHQQIALSDWPALRRDAVDPIAEAEFGFIQSVVSLVRNLKAEADVAFSSIADVSITGADSGTARKHVRLFEHLGKCTLRNATDGFSLSGAVAGAEISLRLDNIIDSGEWLQRQRKRLDKLTSFEKRLHLRLANSRFLEKATDAVVEEHKRRLAETRKLKRKVEELISKRAY
ncbi:MAG: valine--tRNA ligase [Spirochaetales bacterium]|nr:valine--tRNA ligase [Spirochaetales bacterium]